MKLKVLSRSDVIQAVSMAEAIKAVKKGFIQLSMEQAQVPLRTQIPVTNGTV